MNERITEQIVRKHIEASIRNNNCGEIKYWEQIPDNKHIRSLLKNASKSGSGHGKPEFIVTFDERPEFLIVIECKADVGRHISKQQNKPAQFCVDGVVHYAKYLSKEFNVLAIATSGIDKKTLRVSHFLQFRGDTDVESNMFPGKLLPLSDYLDGYFNHNKTHNQDLSKLVSYTKDLNENLHNLRIQPADRSLLISAILTALEDEQFKNEYECIGEAKQLLQMVKRNTLDSMKKVVRPKVLDNIKPSYGFMDADSALTKESALLYLIKDIDKKLTLSKKL